MKIAILGGGGFVGSAVADRLLADHHVLRIFERPRVEPYRKFAGNEQVEWVTGDFTSVHDVSAAIDGVDVVVHLVSTTLPKSSNDDPIYDVQTNVIGTLQLLGLMVPKQIRKIVFISSGGTVYGNPTYLPIDESHPTDPRVPYGITKLVIEKYLLMYQSLYGIKANILRVANPYGERQRAETAQGAVSAFLHKAILNEPIEIWGDGSVTRDYVYISDVAEAFARSIEYDGTKSVFNISSGIGTSLNELIGTIERILGHQLSCHYKPGRPFDISVSVLANSLAREELGWEPRVKLEDGIAKTADWIRKVLASS